MANTNRLFSEIDSPVQRLSPDQDKGIRIYTGPVEIFFRIIGSKLSLLFGFGETIEKSDFLTHQFGCEVYVNKKSFQKFMSRHHVSAIQDTIQREAFLSKLLEIQQPSQQKASSAEIWRLARRLSTHEKASITDGWSKEDFLAWVRAAFPNRQDLEALSKQFQETPSSAEAIDQFQHGLQLLGNLPKAVILETVRKVHIEQPPSQPPKQATLEEELSRLTLKVEGEEPSLSRFRPTSFREIFDWIMLSDELSDSQKVPLLLLYVQQSQNLLTHKLTFKQTPVSDYTRQFFSLSGPIVGLSGSIL